MATYYVNTSSGSDAAAGGIGTPWLTLNYAFAQLTAGDIVKIRGGANYAARVVITEPVELRTSTGFESGTALNPITVSNYDGEYIEFQNSTGTPIYFNGVSHWRIIGLNSGGTEGAASTSYDASDQYFIRFNCNQKASSGYAIRGLSADGIILRYLHVDNGRYFGMIVNKDGDNWEVTRCRIGNNFIGPGSDAHGILFESIATQNENGTISYCVFYDCGADGFVLDLPATTGTKWNGLIIQDSIFRAWATPGKSENGIDLKAQINATIRRCTFYDFTYNDGTVSASGGGGSAAIVCHRESTTGLVIEDCVGYNLSGSLCTINAPYALIKNCEVYDFNFESISGWTPTAFVFTGGGSGNYYLYNNTVYGRHGTTGRLIRVGNRQTATLINNAFHSTGTIQVDAGGNLFASYNCWYNAAQTSVGTGDVTSDPLFVDAAGFNFALQATSPCIDAGTDVGISYTGAAPDMGANERSAGGGGGAATGSVVVARTRVAMNTGTGTQDITTSDLGGLTPSAVLFFITNATADATAVDGARFSVGAATSTTLEWCVGFQAQDAQATTNTDRRSDNTRCLFLLQDGTTFREVAAEFDSFITNGVRINITVASSAYFLEAVFFAGADVTNAYAGYVSLGNTLDLVTDITAPGFQPNLVIAACAHSLNNTATTNANNSIGVVRENSGTVTQRSLCWRDGDADANVTTVSNVSDLYGIHALTSGGAVQWGGEFGAFDASGFSVTTRVAGSSTTSLAYLALKINNASTYVDTFTAPASTGTESTTAPAFEPQFALVGLTMATTVNTVETDGDSENFGVGVWSATGQSFQMVSDDDNAVDSNTYSLNTTTRPILLKNGAQSTNIEATFTGFTATGWDLNYTTTAGTARKGFVLAIQTTEGGGAIVQERGSFRRVFSRVFGRVN